MNIRMYKLFIGTALLNILGTYIDIVVCLKKKVDSYMSF